MDNLIYKIDIASAGTESVRYAKSEFEMFSIITNLMRRYNTDAIESMDFSIVYTWDGVTVSGEKSSDTLVMSVRSLRGDKDNEKITEIIRSAIDSVYVSRRQYNDLMSALDSERRYSDSVAERIKEAVIDINNANLDAKALHELIKLLAGCGIEIGTDLDGASYVSVNGEKKSVIAGVNRYGDFTFERIDNYCMIRIKAIYEANRSA